MKGYFKLYKMVALCVHKKINNKACKMTAGVVQNK